MVRAVALLIMLTPASLLAQASRMWRPDERALLTDLSYVTAVAATRNVVYAATPSGLAIYGRGLLEWRQTVGALEGFPQGVVTAMAADPNDDTAWLAMPGKWIAYDPFTRRVDSGSLPGNVDYVYLDARDPSRGAWFRTVAGWYFVARGSLAAMPSRDVPRQVIGGLSGRELAARLPARDAIRMRIELGDGGRLYHMTSATEAPVSHEVYAGTDGNGTWRIDNVTYATDRLPAGLLGTATGAVASSRGQICAAGDARTGSPHHGIACFDEGLGHFTYSEHAGLAALPFTTVRRLLVTERAIWAATDDGLLRVPRRGGRPVQVQVRDGLPSNQVFALAPAPGGVYVGTLGGLAIVSDTGRGVIVEAHVRGPAVLALASRGDDTVWAGTDAGVVGFLLPLGDSAVVVQGLASLRDRVVGIALKDDVILAATSSRFIIRDAEGWRVTDAPGRPVGELVNVVADADGFWVAGRQGFAFFDPARPLWNALASPDDVPLPVRDIAASRDYVWVATDAGVVRYRKRLLVQ